MRHVVGCIVVACLAMPAAAHAATPEQLFRHIFADPGFMFHPKHRARPQAVVTQPPETPLVDVPMPHIRPGATSGLAYQSEEPRIIAAPLAWAPLPHISPIDTETAAITRPVSPTPPIPPAKAAPATQLAALQPPVLELPPPAASTCGPDLAELGVTAEPLPAIAEGACGIPDPVKLTALAGGTITIKGNATVDCAIAKTLARFVSDTVEPQAEAILNGKVTAVSILDAYTCRNRDGLATAKLSEHAHGNAIDIGGFQIDGKRWITVGDSDNGVPENTFLVAVRQKACGPFTTVLGPGADSYHANHFHLDLIQRRTAGPSHGLFCR